jgi:hypothetical protein
METAIQSSNLNGAALNGALQAHLHSLSPEDQENLLFELLREVYRQNPGEYVIPLVDRNREWLGNLVSPEQPAAAADRLFTEMTPETRHAIMKPLLDIDLDDTLTEKEVKQILEPRA